MRADLAARSPDIEVWPENWPAIELFCAVSTQWRASFGGVIGFDYTAVEAAMRMLRIKGSDRADLFARLRVMEQAALEAFRAKER